MFAQYVSHTIHPFLYKKAAKPITKTEYIYPHFECTNSTNARYHILSTTEQGKMKKNAGWFKGNKSKSHVFVRQQLNDADFFSFYFHLDVPICGLIFLAFWFLYISFLKEKKNHNFMDLSRCLFSYIGDRVCFSLSLKQVIRAFFPKKTCGHNEMKKSRILNTKQYVFFLYTCNNIWAWEHDNSNKAISMMWKEKHLTKHSKRYVDMENTNRCEEKKGILMNVLGSLRVCFSDLWKVNIHWRECFRRLSKIYESEKLDVAQITSSGEVMHCDLFCCLKFFAMRT